jgi:hypothetical protein
VAVAISQTANPAGVAASSTIATYTSVSIGTADANRVVVVVAGTELAGANPSACTIDGVAMNAGTSGDFGAVQTNIFWLPWPSGTTATIAVKYSSVSPSSTQNHIAVYRVVGGAFLSQGQDQSTDMDATDRLTTGAITIPTDGGFIAVAAGATDTVGKTWANATEDLDIDAGGFRFTTATRTTALSATAVTCTGGTNGEDGALNYIIFTEGTNFAATGIATGSPTVGTPALTEIRKIAIFDAGLGPVAGLPIAGQPSAGVNNLTATGIATGAPTVGTPAITQAHGLTATGIATGAPTVGTPAITQAHAVTATGIATGAPTVGSPAITQLHGLTATGIATGSPTVGTPALTQAHGLTADGIDTGAPTVGAPAITQVHDLDATGISTGAPTVGTPALTTDGTDALTADGISTGAPTVGTPALTQVHALLANGIDTGAPTVGSPAMSSDGDVVVPVQPQAGGGWYDWLPRPRPVDVSEDDTPKRKRKKRRRIKADTIELAPDGPVEVQTGIVETAPAWDVLAELQRIQVEAAEARRQRLRAIALADDEWLMMQ